MLELILNWIYISIHAFVWGYGFKCVFHKEGLKWDVVMYPIMGMVLLTAYAQYFSLFFCVSFGANLGLIIIDLALFVIIRKSLVLDL